MNAPRRHGSLSTLGLMIAALMSVMPGGPTASAAGPGESVSYELGVLPVDVTICAQGYDEVFFGIDRAMTVSGVPGTIHSFREGGQIRAESLDEDIARPRRTIVKIPQGQKVGTLQIQGYDPGSTRILVEVRATGDEHLFNVDLSGIPAVVVHVKVVECWEAYTSGLGKVFDNKDVCTLEYPFLLNGTYPGVGGSRPAFFMPRDATSGRWVLIDTLQEAWLIGGIGTYDVVFAIGAGVEEGNIVMTGSGTMTSGPVTLPVNPLSEEIALRRHSNPYECANPLRPGP